MISEMIHWAFANAVMIYGIFWACRFEWVSEIDFPKEITPKNASPELIEKRSMMIGWKIRLWAFKTFGDKWSKPVITCPICMSSIHSTYFYWFFGGFNGCLTSVQHALACIALYCMHVFMTAGFAAIIVSIDES